MRKLFSFAQDALHELQPATAVATVQSAEALRKVLEAQQRLSSHPCETTLKQVISALREAAPDLQQACWLLVSQQKDLKTQVRKHYLEHLVHTCRQVMPPDVYCKLGLTVCMSGSNSCCRQEK